ncbi:50S ribosomal protein L21, mitochondrial-like [Ananas comosus]|uniref:Large ribosomal subunit protein bL21m n=2 Tax=Ananas comosus TaxID=4615 RepID=A0A199W7D8_ANACO|nr:50S ribosomal protein L21, mitochondrial-like [Ananas comosus]OAY85123.1 50S ribosomal protein L21, mitochondrial [Ananas comosus]
MASRRFLGALSRHFRSHKTLSLTLPPLLRPLPSLSTPPPLSAPLRGIQPLDSLRSLVTLRRFSSRPPAKSSDEEDEAEDDDDDDDDEEEEEEEEEEGGESWDGEEEDADASKGSKCIVQRGKSVEEKVKEAAEIGYRVVGSLDPSSENPFKPYEPVFAVVQIGSHQFKVSNGDSIFTEKLKFCEVNDKLVLTKVLMLGSRTQTIIGRPILPDAAVHAVVEEHALDAKVIIFKKKRRKNYRRTKGHRQELTKLRITNIEGIDKSETIAAAA